MKLGELAGRKGHATRKCASSKVKVDFLTSAYNESGKFNALRDFIGIILSADQKPRFNVGICRGKRNLAVHGKPRLVSKNPGNAWVILQTMGSYS